MKSRRDFLRLAATIGGTGLAGSFSRFGLLNALTCPASTDYKALVCVFLFGGNDSNNLIIPTDSTIFNSQYTKIRQNLALPLSSLHQVETSSKATYGFHANLADLQTLWTNKNLAVVANVGTLVQPLTRQQYISNVAPTPTNLFSHSDQQMEWQTAVTHGIATSGWAGRVADKVSSMNSPSTFPTFVSVAGNSIFGTGDVTRPATVIPGAPLGLQGFNTTTPSMDRELAEQTLLTLNSGATLIQQANKTLHDGITDSATLSKAIASAAPIKTVFPTGNSLASQLLEVAKIIQVRQDLCMKRQIFFCSLGGFDTHTNQLNDQGRLFSLLGPALKAFHDATVELGIDRDVVTFTESDFSRTLQPNTNGGTDHAWGSHHLVIGGGVRGGDLYGHFPTLDLNTGNDAGGEGRWIPTTAIDQYGATLASWFGVTDTASLNTVFPNLANFSTKTLQFV